MVLFPHGNHYLPIDLIEDVDVVDSFLLPGLVLGLAFGVGSLIALVGLVRQPDWSLLAGLETLTGRHWSWAAAVLVGWGFTAWMVVEVALLGGPWAAETTEELAVSAVLQGTYGLVAVLLLALPWAPALRRSLATDRHLVPTD